MVYDIIRRDDEKEYSPSKVIFKIIGVGVLAGVGYYIANHEIKLVPRSAAVQQSALAGSSAGKSPRTEDYEGHRLIHDHQGECKLNHKTIDDILKKK